MDLFYIWHKTISQQNQIRYDCFNLFSPCLCNLSSRNVLNQKSSREGTVSHICNLYFKGLWCVITPIYIYPIKHKIFANINCALSRRDPFYYNWLTLIPSWISNHIPYKPRDEIPYTFPNFNGKTVEIWERISNFIRHFTRHAATSPCWGKS